MGTSPATTISQEAGTNDTHAPICESGTGDHRLQPTRNQQRQSNCVLIEQQEQKQKNSTRGMLVAAGDRETISSCNSTRFVGSKDSLMATG
mmetsp:Transcript_49719/g.105876  ORF Transcript_49719/g.105876 Transcript_49719/m.105876 type:complete len:91 (-) Transcript_49719:682-954(-)